MELLKWIATSITVAISSLFGVALEPPVPTLVSTPDEYTNVRSLADLGRARGTAVDDAPQPAGTTSLEEDEKPSVLVPTPAPAKKEAAAPAVSKSATTASSDTKSYFSPELGIRFVYPAAWDVEYVPGTDGKAHIILAPPDFKLDFSAATEMMTLAFEGTWTGESEAALVSPQLYVDEKLATYKKIASSGSVVEQIMFKAQPAFLRRGPAAPGIASAFTVYDGKEFGFRYFFPTWDLTREAMFTAVAKSIQFEKPSGATISTTRKTQADSNLSAQLLASKRDQAFRAAFAFEPSLYHAMLKLVLQARASKLTDIPNVKAFGTAQYARATSMYSDSSKAHPTEAQLNTMTSAELDALIALYAKRKQEMMTMLTAYNALPVAELEKLDAEKPVVDLEGGPPPFPVTSP